MEVETNQEKNEEKKFYSRHCNESLRGENRRFDVIAMNKVEQNWREISDKFIALNNKKPRKHLQTI